MAKLLVACLALTADAGNRHDTLRHRHSAKQAPVMRGEGHAIGEDWTASRKDGATYDPEWTQPDYVPVKTEKKGEDGAKFDPEKQEKDMVPIPYLPAELVYAPTQQPATWAQDMQECALVRLPTKFVLAPRVENSVLQRAGVWENLDGATYLSWTQDHFSWGYNSVSYFDGAVPFFTVNLVDEKAIRDMGIDLPDPAGNAKVTTLVVRDCQGVLMYVMREHKENINTYEVYNRAGEFVAGSTKGQLYQDQIHWYDHDKQPIAIAQSPFISTQQKIDEIYKDQRADGKVKQWEIEFIQDYGSNSSMLRDQYRWVLGAALQTRAIREADMGPGGEMAEPWIYPWFIAIQLTLFLVLLYAIYKCFQGTYHIVYQSPPKAAIQNPYLRDFAPYGALERR